MSVCGAAPLGRSRPPGRLKAARSSEIFDHSPALVFVKIYRRRLPHYHPLKQPLFITWRLAGSLPPHRAFPPTPKLSSGKAFVVMSNHVHMLLTPHVAVPKLLGSLKSITAKRATQILDLTGRPFWQEESYDHVG
ncbi:MAG: hypothetical protein ABFD86_04095 [Bryobacteraceae bacterium]